MAKLVRRVEFRLGQSGRGSKTGHGSKRVIFKRVKRVTGQTGCGSNGSGQTGLTRFAMSTRIGTGVSCLHSNFLFDLGEKKMVGLRRKNSSLSTKIYPIKYLEKKKNKK